MPNWREWLIYLDSFLNVGRARLVEATEFVLMPAPIEKWKQMKSDKANELKQKISKINHLKRLV